MFDYELQNVDLVPGSCMVGDGHSSGVLQGHSTRLLLIQSLKFLQIATASHL